MEPARKIRDQFQQVKKGNNSMHDSEIADIHSFPLYTLLGFIKAIKYLCGICVDTIWPAEILEVSKECKNPQEFLPPNPCSKTCYRYMHGK